MLKIHIFLYKIQNISFFDLNKNNANASLASTAILVPSQHSGVSVFMRGVGGGGGGATASLNTDHNLRVHEYAIPTSPPTSVTNTSRSCKHQSGSFVRS